MACPAIHQGVTHNPLVTDPLTLYRFTPLEQPWPLVPAWRLNKQEGLWGAARKAEVSRAVAWSEGTNRCLRLDRDLSLASRSTELLNTVDVHGRTGPSISQVPTARAEGVWSLDSNVSSEEVGCIPLLDSMPLEGLQGSWYEGREAVVGVEYIHIARSPA